MATSIMDDRIIPPLPVFLTRRQGDTHDRRVRRRLRSPWKPTKGLRAAKKRASKRQAERVNAIAVYNAVQAGAWTLGTIRTATGLGNAAIKTAIRAHNRNTPASRHIIQDGKQYRAR